MTRSVAATCGGPPCARERAGGEHLDVLERELGLARGPLAGDHDVDAPARDDQLRRAAGDHLRGPLAAAHHGTGNRAGEQVLADGRPGRDGDRQPLADHELGHRDGAGGREALRHAPHGEVARLDAPAGDERLAGDEDLDRRPDLVPQRRLPARDVRRGQRAEHEREAEQQRRPTAPAHEARGG